MIDSKGMVSARFRSTERFIIRLGHWNPGRDNIRFMHSIIYMMEMRLHYIDLNGILIWIEMFSEHWKLCYECIIPSPRSFNSHMRSYK